MDFAAPPAPSPVWPTIFVHLKVLSKGKGFNPSIQDNKIDFQNKIEPLHFHFGVAALTLFITSLKSSRVSLQIAGERILIFIMFFSFSVVHI